MDKTRTTSKPQTLNTPGRTFSLIDLMLLAMILIWGINFSVVKAALAEMTPLSFNSIRFLLASTLTLLSLKLVEGGVGFAREDWWRLLGLGLIGNTCYQLLFINGIDRTTAGNSALLLATTPIFVSLIGAAFGVERVGKLAWVGVFLSFAGIFTVIVGSGKELSLSMETIRGDVLTLIGAAAWSLYTVLSKPMLSRYSALKLTALAMAAGTPFIVLFSIPQLLAQDWTAVSWRGWLGLFFSGSMAIALAYIIWNSGVSKVGGTRTAVYSNLSPIIATIFAWLTLGETITAFMVVGAAMIFLGIYLTRRSNQRQGNRP
ncbi:MAG: DMT family transporter [Anaerolineae bacterium]